MDTRCVNRTRNIGSVRIFHDYPDVISPSDLCAMLGISKNTAYGLLKSGEIKSRRMGRMYKIPKQEVIDYLSDNSQ